jgi:uncharacterized protein with gpF-like domain
LKSMSKAFDNLLSQSYWRDIQSSTLLSLTDTLTAGIEQGLSIPNLRKLIQSEHATISKWRATAIARTETNAVMSLSHTEALSSLAAAGDSVKKTWLAVVDADTRADHAEADGQTVGVDEDFNVGGESCRHPGDVMLSAAQRVNCRCTVVGEWSD